MTRWRDVGRALADPEAVARWAALLVAAVSAVGFARALGVSVHPLWGWGFLFLVAAAAASALWRRWLDERMTARAAAERDRRSDGEVDPGAVLDGRRVPGGPEVHHPDAGTAPRPGWTR